MTTADDLAKTILRTNGLSPSDWDTYYDIRSRHMQESSGIPHRYKSAWEFSRAVHADRQLLIDLIGKVPRP